MKDISKNTKTFKILSALTKGELLTEASAFRKYDVWNLRAEISRLRSNGYAVFAKKTKTKFGVETAYQLGKPTREMIALAYKAKRLGIKV